MARPFRFDPITKQRAFFRQWNLCAHCTQSLINAYDHAHHVVPNQVGRPGNRADAWIRELDNCVVLCDDSHGRVHENGRYRFGAVASPDDFPYSHGRKTKVNPAAEMEHRVWADRMRFRFWTT